MPIAPLLQRFVDDELAQAPALAGRAAAAAAAALLQDHAGDAEAFARRDAAAALQSRAPALAAEFRAALGALVAADLAGDGQPAPAAPAPGLPATLTLMDEAVVEADIEISRAAMQIDAAVEWEQRELQTFTSALRGEAHVGEASNPIRPTLVARAMWEASAALALAPAARLHALRALAAAVGQPLKKAFAAACTRLESQGVTPSQYRTVVVPGGSALAALREIAPARASHPGAGQGGSTPHPGALRALLARVKAVPPAADAPPLPPAPDAPASPARDGTSAAPSMAGVDPRLVELVTRLFETLLADPGLTEPARRAIARLQGSVVRVALRDPALLDGEEHPTWRLLDRIASACEAAACAGAHRLAALGDRCARLAEELARHPSPDAALHRQGLARLEAQCAEELQIGQREARDAIEALQRTERRRQLQAQVRQRLREQFQRHPVGPATRHWLEGNFAQRIAEAMLVEGPDGPATAALTRTVDDLLWSLHPPPHPASRQRLVKMLPALIARLRTAMTEGGVPAAEEQSVLAEMEAAHSATLWPAPGAGATEETPEEIVRRLREEVADEDGEPRREFGDSVMDLSTLDTVPAELMPQFDGVAGPAQAARAQQSRATVAALAPGRAARLLLQGHWHDTQLLWRTADGELLLFIDRRGVTQALTRLALERLHGEGLARLDAPASRVRRAIDALGASPDVGG